MTLRSGGSGRPQSRRFPRRSFAHLGFSLLWLASCAALLMGYVGLAHCRTAAGSLAERLGYEATDRLLIIHADDAGMCHSENVATIRAMEYGVVTCASVMVPCRGFPEMARYARSHPQADLGVHLTLTSEWDTYRWGPVSPAGQVPGLIDREGCFPHTLFGTMRSASAAEVETEVRSQILRARQAGIRPTHVDTHMGTLFAPKFQGVYTGVAREAGLMPMLVSPTTPQRYALAELMGVDPVDGIGALRRQGFVFLDGLNTGEGGDTLEARRAHFDHFLRSLPAGVTQMIVHVSLDGPDIRAITDTWQDRWNDYRIVTDPRTRELIDSLGIKLIGYRELSRLFGRS